ncbi:MAG: DUF983 domain-containing protein [Alphaproteobacteria bacterium]|nr:DUF983 domain-containing protein [Alphaproteobacteria bacterium]
MPKPKRRLGQALQRGLRGRCPACGKGRLLRNYLTPNTTCGACGEDFSRYQAADFAPYLVTFLVGMIFTPLTLVLSTHANDFTLPILLLAALASAILLLPPIKGAALGLLWAVNETN